MHTHPHLLAAELDYRTEDLRRLVGRRRDERRRMLAGIWRAPK